MADIVREHARSIARDLREEEFRLWCRDQDARIMAMRLSITLEQAQRFCEERESKASELGIALDSVSSILAKEPTQ